MGWIKKVDTLTDRDLIRLRPGHLKSRLIVSLILLLFSAAGLFIMVFAPSFAWHYWVFVVPIFAVLCIWLSWHVSRTHTVSGMTIWHEILHWIALLVAVFLVSSFVQDGIINYVAGALFVLILLSLTIFLAGIYFDAIFMLIGILLAVLALGSAFFVKYLVAILIPIIALVGLFLFWRFFSQKRIDKSMG